MAVQPPSDAASSSIGVAPLPGSSSADAEVDAPVRGRRLEAAAPRSSSSRHRFTSRHRTLTSPRGPPSAVACGHHSGIPCAKLLGGSAAGDRRRATRRPHDDPAGHHPRHRPGTHRVPADLELRAPPASCPGCSTGTSCSSTPAQQDLRRRAAPGHVRRRSSLYFWRDIGRLLAAWVRSIARRSLAEPEARLAWLLLVSTIPAAIVGVAARGLHHQHAGQALDDRRADDRLRRLVMYARRPRRASSTADLDAAHLGRRAAHRRRAGARPRSRRLALRHHHGHGPAAAPRPRVGGALLVPDEHPGDRRRRRLQGPGGRQGRPARRHRRALRRRHRLGGAQRLRRHLVPARLPQRHDFNLFVVYRIAVGVGVLILMVAGCAPATGI